MAVFNSESVHFKYLSAEQFTLTGGTLGDSAIASNAGIQATKLQHRYHFFHSQSGTVAAATQYFRILQATGESLSIEAAVTEAVATGADRTVTIDLKRSTGGGAFASILTSTIVFNNVSTLRAISTGAINTSTLSDGDMLQLTVAVAGAAGAQAQGLLVSVTIRENAI